MNVRPSGKKDKFTIENTIVKKKNGKIISDKWTQQTVTRKGIVFYGVHNGKVVNTVCEFRKSTKKNRTKMNRTRKKK